MEAMRHGLANAAIMKALGAQLTDLIDSILPPGYA
jgi:hypothetical protein